MVPTNIVNFCRNNLIERNTRRKNQVIRQDICITDFAASAKAIAHWSRAVVFIACGGLCA